MGALSPALLLDRQMNELGVRWLRGGRTLLTALIEKRLYLVDLLLFPLPEKPFDIYL